MAEIELIKNACKPQGYWGKKMIESMNEHHFDVTSWGLSHVKFKSDAVILDIGCGGGKTVERLSDLSPNGRVFGLDYSDLCVEESKKLCKKLIEENRVQIDCGSVSQMPYSDNTFDSITAVETFYFWPDPVNDLKEVRRVLKENGELLLVFESCYDENEPDKWDEFVKTIDLKVPHRDVLEGQLKEAGFKSVKTYIHENGCWLCAVAVK